jgi:hypothetical protein
MADNRPPDPMTAKLAELDRLIEQQKERLAQMSAPSAGISADDLRAILQAQNDTQKALIEQTRPVRHSNPDHLHVSAFSYPEGDLKRPKPTFLAGKNGKPREVFYNNHRENPEDLTPAEIEAFNAITHSCEAREGKWTAVVKANALYVNIPSFTPDDRMDLPNGLVLILRELAEGPQAVDVNSLAAEVAMLRQALKDGRIVTVPA